MAKCINNINDISFIECEDTCPSNKCYIYVLCNPDTNEIRYVGRTIYKLSVRLNCHCCMNGVRSNFNYRNKNWIKHLLNNGKKPIIKVIDIVDIDDWPYYEKYYIDLLKGFNINLNNHNEGGLGNTRSCAKKWTIEQKERKRKILQSRNKGLFLIDHNNNVVLSNTNISYISNYLNYDARLISNSYRRGNKILHKYFVVNDLNNIPSLYKKPSQIKLTNLHKDEILIFNNMKEVCVYLNSSMSNISIHIKYNKPINNYILEKYYE